MDDSSQSLAGSSNERVQSASSTPSHAPPPAHIAPNPLPANPHNVKAPFTIPNDIELEAQLIRDIKVENEKCTSYAPTVFKKLRKIFNIAPTAYKVSNCKSDYAKSI